MTLKLKGELTEWLHSNQTRSILGELVREAIRVELREALDDELLDTYGPRSSCV